MKQSEFVYKCILKYGFKYDYTKVIYKNNKSILTINCPEHGDFNMRASHFLNYGCKECNKIKHKINFINNANIFHNNKYDYSLVEYVNSYTNIKIICPIHGNFFQTPNTHLSCECPDCSKISKTLEKRKQEFINKANIFHNNKYDYSLVNYTNNKTEVEIICPIHKNFFQRPDSHLRCGCNQCGTETTKSKTKNNFELLIPILNEIHNNKYDYSLVDYINNNTNVKIICPIHDVFEQTIKNHFNHGCPKCNESKGEKEISKLLKENNIEYITQKRFDDCKNKRCLPFDFYLPEHNICIEYDGLQHYKPIVAFGGEKKFEQTKINDKIKTTFCLNNNIRLIRIKYNEKIENKINFLLL